MGLMLGLVGKGLAESKGLENAATGYVKGMAGQAYTDATKDQTATDSSFEGVDPNAVYIGPGSDGQMTNAEAASHGLLQPSSETTKYGVGSAAGLVKDWQDKPLTSVQKRAAGLAAQAQFHYGRGESEEGNKLLSQASQIRLGELGVTKAEDEESARKRVRDVWTAWQKPLDRLKQMYNNDVGLFGQDHHKGSKGDFIQHPDGSVTVYQTDKNGAQLPGQTATTLSADDVQNYVDRQRMVDLAAADPEKYGIESLKYGIKKSEIALHAKHYEAEGKHWDAQAKAAERHITVQEEANRIHKQGITDTNASRERIAQIGADARSQYVPKYHSPTMSLTDGTPVQFATDGSGAVNAVTGKPLSDQQLKMLPKAGGAPSSLTGKELHDIEQTVREDLRRSVKDFSKKSLEDQDALVDRRIRARYGGGGPLQGRGGASLGSSRSADGLDISPPPSPLRPSTQNPALYERQPGENPATALLRQSGIVSGGDRTISLRNRPQLVENN